MDLTIKELAVLTFGKDPKQFLKKYKLPDYRAIFNLSDNETQCNNTIGPCKRDAICYLCGLTIECSVRSQTGGAPECEHVLSISQSVLLYTLWSRRGMASGMADPLDKINLIYKWAHRRCNMVKLDDSFIKLDSDKTFRIDERVIREFYTKLYTAKRSDDPYILNGARRNMRADITAKYTSGPAMFGRMIQRGSPFMNVLQPILDDLNSEMGGRGGILMLYAFGRLFKGGAVQADMAEHIKTLSSEELENLKKLQADADELEAIEAVEKVMMKRYRALSDRLYGIMEPLQLGNEAVSVFKRKYAELYYYAILNEKLDTSVVDILDNTIVRDIIIGFRNTSSPRFQIGIDAKLAQLAPGDESILAVVRAKYNSTERTIAEALVDLDPYNGGGAAAPGGGGTAAPGGGDSSMSGEDASSDENWKGVLHILQASGHTGEVSREEEFYSRERSNSSNDEFNLSQTGAEGAAILRGAAGGGGGASGGGGGPVSWSARGIVYQSREAAEAAQGANLGGGARRYKTRRRRLNRRRKTRGRK